MATRLGVARFGAFRLGGDLAQAGQAAVEGLGGLIPLFTSAPHRLAADIHVDVVLQASRLEVAGDPEEALLLLLGAA